MEPLVAAEARGCGEGGVESASDFVRGGEVERIGGVAGGRGESGGFGGGDFFGEVGAFEAEAGLYPGNGSGVGDDDLRVPEPRDVTDGAPDREREAECEDPQQPAVAGGGLAADGEERHDGRDGGGG